MLKLPWSQSFLIGVVLAQLGEFAFLLTIVGHEAKIINTFGEKLIIALTVLSLSFSPFWLSAARRLKTLADNTTSSFGGVLYWLYGGQVHSFKKRYDDFVKGLTNRPKALTDQRKKHHLQDADDKNDIDETNL